MTKEQNRAKWSNIEQNGQKDNLVPYCSILPSRHNNLIQLNIT